ncbi:MAG TPA: hypothetical protein IAB84_08180 [Candidatus Choladousia intestinigallinarum]|nr:hypothetical protein [Candidatus Choladousia intestinigallinarum]
MLKRSLENQGWKWYDEPALPEGPVFEGFQEQIVKPETIAKKKTGERFYESREN